MPRRPPQSARRNARSPRRGRTASSSGLWKRREVWIGAIVLALATVGAVAAWWRVTLPARRVARAEAASKAGDFAAAFDAWRIVNATGPPRPGYLKAEARAALRLGRAAVADDLLARAAAADPADPEPWRLRLERLRVLDLPLEALALGWSAFDAVPADERRGILRELTLALLADLPDDLARSTLARWAGADPTAPDLDARVALLRRFAALPQSGDPDRAARIDELTRILAANPAHLAAREALVVNLLDSGDPGRARVVLDAWPAAATARDARFWRLRGRFDLDYDHKPAAAVEAFARALTDLPHDWKTRVRLSRAYHALGREADARREADAVARTREVLDPSTLGPRLAADLDRLDRPPARHDLADLCDRAGLSRLADAWRREAAIGP